jgi:glycosyltransferase involved in cell wall biosynthesis
MPARAAYPKDHETLVRAFEQLDDFTSLSLVGDRTDSVAFREQLKVWAPKRHQEIVTLGLRTDIADLLKSSHVMVLSSRSEAMPLSILEAMSCGLPVIASEVGGTREQIIHGSTGLLVPAGAVWELAQAMRDLLDENVRFRLGAAGRLRYEQDFSVDCMSENVLELYRKFQMPCA